MANNYAKHSYDIDDYDLDDAYFIVRDGIRKTCYHAKDREGAINCIKSLIKRDIKNETYTRYVALHQIYVEGQGFISIEKDKIEDWTCKHINENN